MNNSIQQLGLDEEDFWKMSSSEWVALFGWAPRQHHACDTLFGRFSEEARCLSFQILTRKSVVRR